MKEKILLILEIIIVIAVAYWILLRIAFPTDIKQDLTAQIFQDGVAVDETTIHIDGERKKYIFSDHQSYSGLFWIESYERTGREDMHVGINWESDELYGDRQNILYIQNGTFPELKLNGEIIINLDMNNIAIGFKDGTIVATSFDEYIKYIEKFEKWN